MVRFEETGAEWQGNWKIYLVSQPLATSDETYAYPNPFYPNSPPGQVVRIKYSTDGKSVPVTIRIFDFGMNYVKTIIQNKMIQSNSQISAWDGTADNGKIVPNGVYFYRIDRGSLNPIFGKIILIQ